MKATVPEIATLPAGAVSVAVKVTDWFRTEGFGEEASARLVPALFTVCVKAPGVTVKFGSPP